MGHGAWLGGGQGSMEVVSSSPIADVFFSLKKIELTSWWSGTILSTKNRRGELWDSQLTSHAARIVSSAFAE